MALAFGLAGEGKSTSVVVDEITDEDPINLRHVVAGGTLRAPGRRDRAGRALRPAQDLVRQGAVLFVSAATSTPLLTGFGRQASRARRRGAGPRQTPPPRLVGRAGTATGLALCSS